MLPSSPRVWLAPAPAWTAPMIMKIEAMMAAVLNFSILVPTAVPKMFEASLAPNDQPRKSPLEMNMKNKCSIFRCLF